MLQPHSAYREYHLTASSGRGLLDGQTIARVIGLSGHVIL